MPYDLEMVESAQMVIFDYIHQAAPDIKKKLQSLERLGEKNLSNLVAVAETVYNNREIPEQREENKEKRQERSLNRILEQ